MSAETVTAALRKSVAQLSRSKYRRETGLFVAEGSKCVCDTLDYFDCTALFAAQTWLDSHKSQLGSVDALYRASASDLERMSQLQSPPDVIAVYRQPSYSLDLPSLDGRLTVALDRVQDPGNLGTIIRVCDWMGVSDILASEGTADVYNPKVVQATMGSIARVRVHYVDLPQTLSALSCRGLPVYGTFLDGRSIYDTCLDDCGIIVVGNEGRGISDAVAQTVTERLLIPSYPPDAPTAESLNVAIATAITLAEFRRPRK